MPQYEMSRNRVENAGLPAVFGDLYRESKFAVRLWLSGLRQSYDLPQFRLLAGAPLVSTGCEKFFTGICDK
jgi:hypothetical protein